MTTYTLQDLINKVRKITARPSVNQISDNTIIDYLNLFYLYDFPQNLKVFDFHTTYRFITQPNVDIYPLSQTNRNLYKSFEPPAYCSGYNISYYQSREQFFKIWPNLYSLYNIGVATAGTGAGPYTLTMPSVPVLESNVLISVLGTTGITLTATDLPTPWLSTGTLTGDATGTIDYVSGVIVITWNIIPVIGSEITVKCVPYSSSRPLSILFFDNTFTLRPVPDDTYTIELQSYITPFSVSALGVPEGEYSSTDLAALPLLNDYFQLIAYGAARKIFLDSLEMENLANIEPFYKEQLNYAERKTMMQIKTQRTPTIYMENPYWTSNRMPTN